jgi:hypothetical protein
VVLDVSVREVDRTLLLALVALTLSVIVFTNAVPDDGCSATIEIYQLAAGVNADVIAPLAPAATCTMSNMYELRVVNPVGGVRLGSCVVPVTTSHAFETPVVMLGAVAVVLVPNAPVAVPVVIAAVFTPR